MLGTWELAPLDRIKPGYCLVPVSYPPASSLNPFVCLLPGGIKFICIGRGEDWDVNIL